MKLLLDILLMPAEMYRKIGARRSTLYLGIWFVGLFDIGLPYLMETLDTKLPDTASENVLRSIGLVLLFSVVVGVLDVIVFSIPLFDLFKKFKKQEGVNYGDEQGIRLMKVYIVTHIVLLPAHVIYAFATRNLTDSSPMEIIEIAAYASILLIIWFNAVVTRGTNAIYKFEFIFKKLVFPVVFVWGWLSGAAVTYAIENWIMPLIK